MKYLVSFFFKYKSLIKFDLAFKFFYNKNNQVV
jgi:hypothetical protein